MTILIEVLSTMWQVIWGLLSGTGKAVFENLPALLELKKIILKQLNILKKQLILVNLLP